MEITKVTTYLIVTLALVFGGYWIKSNYFTDPQEKLVQGFLQTLNDKNEAKAYESYTSAEFQLATSYDEFHRFLESHPALNNHNLERFDDGIAMIQSEDTKHQVQFDFVEQDGAPKVYSFQLFSPLSAKAPQLTLNKIIIGDEVNKKGEIVSPIETIPHSAEQIYINVYVSSSTRGEKVLLYLTHVESGQEVLPLATSLQQEGDSMLSFSYSAPFEGWPKGEYLVEARSDGESISIRFVID